MGSEESARALTARILHSAPPRTLRADVPRALEDLLARCLAKSPEQRPASALELARDLQRVQRDEGLALTTISVDEGGTAPAPLEAVPGEPAPRVEEPRSGEPVAPPARRRGISATGWWSAAAVALVVIVALLAWRAASAGDRSFAPGSAPPGPRLPRASYHRRPSPRTVPAGTSTSAGVPRTRPTPATPTCGGSAVAAAS
jgi:serine/threonine protein kinase